MAEEKKKECESCAHWGKPDVDPCEPCCCFPWFTWRDECEDLDPPVCQIEEFEKAVREIREDQE